MGLKLIVVAYFTLVSMVFAFGVIALSIDSRRPLRCRWVFRSQMLAGSASLFSWP